MFFTGTGGSRTKKDDLRSLAVVSSPLRPYWVLARLKVAICEFLFYGMDLAVLRRKLQGRR